MDGETILLAVNGTLMRDQPLSHHLTEHGAVFDRQAATAPVYRLWTIDDVHPAMIRTTGTDGRSIRLEIWRIPLAGITRTLVREPPGLSIGKIILDDGTTVLGVLAEPALVEGHREITEFGGWLAYLAARDQRRIT